jgi:hypothetical protein
MTTSGSSTLEFRTGGRQKRQKLRDEHINTATSNVESHVLTSKLAKHLIYEWAWGFCSAVHVQKFAEASLIDQRELLRKVVTDPATHDSFLASDLRELAKLGAHGKYPGNVNRDLITFLGKPNLPLPIAVNIPVQLQKFKAHALSKARITPKCKPFCKAKSKGKAKSQPNVAALATVFVPMFFLLPHMLFHHLFINCKGVFNKLFIGHEDGDCGRVTAFWKEVSRRKDPRIQHHDMLQRTGWAR